MADVKMVNLTIEGRAVSVPDGTTILEAAKAAGVLVPHYCYHPGLPVAGVCRMCLVEVEKMPKLAPSCATNVGEGQVVHVYSEKALGSFFDEHFASDGLAAMMRYVLDANEERVTAAA